MTSGYFIDKARAVIAAADGDPDVAGPLAQWAEEARQRGDELAGVIVAQDGTILAETRRTPSRPGRAGATYVDSITDAAAAYGVGPKDWGIIDCEVGRAMARLTRETGQPVIHVRYGEVCIGSGESAARDAAQIDRGGRPVEGRMISTRIPEEDITVLDSVAATWSQAEGRPVSRAEVIRRIISDWIETAKTI